MMSAIVPGSHSPPVGAHAVEHESDRQKLQENLLAAAKMCHARFGGKAELATDSDACVTHLCSAIEEILGHGLKSNRGEKINAALR